MAAAVAVAAAVVVVEKCHTASLFFFSGSLVQFEASVKRLLNKL